MLYQYGVPESDLLTWSVLNKAMTTYQMHVLKRDQPKASICPICGPRPNFLCCDGVAIGCLVDKVENEKREDLFLEMESANILEAPPYSEWQLIRKRENRF